MGFPFPQAQQPYIDSFGSAAEYSPYVGRSTAGALAPGQSLLSACGRIATLTGSAVTVPILTVPAGKTFFITDLTLTTIAAVEVDTQVSSGAVPIDRAVCSSTSPINVVHETQPLATGNQVVSVVLPATGGGAINVDFFIAGYLQAPPQ